jgi:Uma2 family endonuclease
MTTTTHITAEQLLEGGYDHCELIAGEIVYMAPGNFEHGDVALEVAFAIKAFVAARKLGRVLAAETGFVIARGPDTVLAPDVAFVRQARVPKGRHILFYEGAPDLAVEVMSPSDRVTAARAKAARWIGGGAESVWIVNPSKRTIEVHHSSGTIRRFSDSEVLKDEPTLPGFSLNLGDVFRDS